MKNKQKNFKTVLTLLKATSFTFVLVVLFLIVAPTVFAQALQTGIQYGTATGLGTQDVRISIMKIVRIFLGFVGVIALLIVLYGGWMWMSSAGRPDRIEQAKSILRNAAIGLAIILLAFSIVSFIINLLQGATIGGGTPGGGPPGGGCTNCGYLGTGIIEAVYPAPFSRDNSRNTNIIVTFKVAMAPGTIIEGAPATCSVATPCSGNMVADSVAIYPSSDDTATLDAARVSVRSVDGKTFVFNPADYLGNSNDNVWYSVQLNNDIQKANGSTAFPGAGGFFIWRFEIGTFLDLDPLEASNVFPAPDDSSDTYANVAATQATGSITVSAQPNFAQNSATKNLTALVGNAAVLSGNYNCGVDATISVTAVTPTNFTINPSVSVGGLASTATINAGSSISLGCGLTMTLNSPVAGNQWRFDALAQHSADTLQVSNTTYTFVQGVATGNQISVGTDAQGTAANIATALSNNSSVEVVSVSGAKINLRSPLAGQQGNGVALVGGNWANIAQMSGGQDAVLQPTTVNVADQPRNAIIVLNFNEAVDPTLVNDQTIQVFYFNTSLPTPTWVKVTGNYFVSNQYKTVEFLPDSQCLDSFNNPIANSCGDPMFCLPVVDPDPSPYEATAYRVTVNAGQLTTCSNNSDCADPNFNICTSAANGNRICGGTFDGTPSFYPEIGALPNGLADAANNTFNGNSNTYTFNGQKYGDAEGPTNQSGQNPYSLNTVDLTQGDDLTWDFFVNKNIDLAPPVIETIEPNINSSGVSTADPISATFEELMMSKSLKPGTGYKDGLCGFCTTNAQCGSGQVCSPLSNTCVNEEGEKSYCAEDNDCPSGLSCINKKYVTLIDLSVSPVGWWVTNDGLDTVLPPDNYPDKTVGHIEHTPFSVVTNYGAEFGSGVQDVYQNCFIPSEGPDVSGGGCNTTPTEPYCCSGQALNETQWQASQCFTGF